MARSRNHGPLRWMALAGLSLGAITARAATPAPGLAETDFYTTTVHGCEAMDLATWQHPTRDVLRSAQATVVKVELCNAGRFPVFTVNLPYDPEAHTGSYFSKLYADLAEANGFWSYALVDLSDDVIITAAIRRPDQVLTLSYEKFSQPR